MKDIFISFDRAIKTLFLGPLIWFIYNNYLRENAQPDYSAAGLLKYAWYPGLVILYWLWSIYFGSNEQKNLSPQKSAPVKKSNQSKSVSVNPWLSTGIVLVAIVLAAYVIWYGGNYYKV